MRHEIYQAIDEYIQSLSLSKEEIDQLYLEEGIIDKSLENQVKDIEKELDELTDKYGMSAEDRLLNLLFSSSSNLRKDSIAKDIAIYEKN